MKIPGLRAADEMVGGLAHFGRMLDKIRLAAADALPDGYFLGDEDFFLVGRALLPLPRRRLCRAEETGRGGRQ